MKFEHRSLLEWLFRRMDQIGVCEIDFDEFAKHTDGLITEKDIDPQGFIDDCNNDGKKRMVWVDNYRKLWFTPTIIFRNANNAGFRRMVNNQRDLALLRHLSLREQTRTWMVEQAVHNERLEVSKDLIKALRNDERSNESHREFADRIAKKMGFKIPKGKDHPDAIKERFGCECQYCGEIFAKELLEIDHVVPQSIGHKEVNRTWNKVPVCKECNQNKGNMNVFAFLQASNFNLLNGVKIAVEKWVKLGVLEYPTRYRDKRNKKEKTYTWRQVQDYVFNNPSVTTSDFELINPDAPVDERRWRRKNGSSK